MNVDCTEVWKKCPSLCTTGWHMRQLLFYFSYQYIDLTGSDFFMLRDLDHQ